MKYSIHSTGFKNLYIRNGVYQARVQLNGKDHWRSLHIDAHPENLKFAKDAVRALRVRLAQDSFAILNLTKSRSDYSTLGEVFAAYHKVCLGRDILDATTKTTVSRFRHICATVHGADFDVDAARTSIVTRELVQKFEFAKISAVKAAAAADEAAGKPWTTETLEKCIQAAKNSAKSTLQQARALFARAVLQSVHYLALVLPDLGPFLTYRIAGATTISAFVAPPQDAWARIVADLVALKVAQPGQWLAFQLGANCGLRRSSARNARWDWCVEQPDGAAAMRVGRAKGNNSTVTIAPAVWAEMKAVRTTLEYILPGVLECGPESRDQVIEDLVAWLRLRGLTVDVARCPFHLLRKIFGDSMRQTHGLDEAQKALGHSSSRLTHAVYSDHRSTNYVQVV